MYSVFIIKDNVIEYLCLEVPIKMIQNNIAAWLYNRNINGYNVEQFNKQCLYCIEQNITIQIVKDLI